MYKVIPFFEEDSDEICTLYHHAFQQSMCDVNSQKLFKWFYFNNVYSKNYSKGVHNGDRFLSYWGFIPLDCIIGKNILKGALSLQLVSGDGAFGTTLPLWKNIKKNLEKDEIALSFTINHHNSLALLNSVSWESQPTPILFFPSHFFKLISDQLIKRVKNKVLIKIIESILLFFDLILTKITKLFHKKSYKINFVKSFNDDNKDLFSTVNNSIKNGIFLNQTYLNWRYVNKPNNQYKILSFVENGVVKGYLIFSIKIDFGTKMGYIMDIIADPKDKSLVNDLINFAKIELFKDDVTIISGLSFKENLYYKNYKNCGFKELPNLFLPHKSYFSLCSLKYTKNKITPSEWHISWGNHDNI